MDEEAPAGILNPLETFGIDVREMRKARRMTLEGLANATSYSVAYVSKVERAIIVPSAAFAEGCDRAFGTGTVLARQRQAAVEGDHPSWFVPYLQHERQATRIFAYSTLCPNGILQTPGYARGLYEMSVPRLSEEQVETKVLARMARREILDRIDPPRPELWVVLHEACLRVEVGGRRVMAGQLQSLLDDAQRQNVSLQLLPNTVAPVTSRPFTVLAFESAPMVLHAEGPQGGRPQEAPKITAAAMAVYDRLRAEALGRAETISRVRKVLEEYTR
ncbi:helix-turn-helix domain-containing protein [Streptomyces yaizuensis]|uniref:Scr1 family TA system antitoxin-like transcriptional regulator n=1 Tax=Streptomyces yaizuensis TaxID=2989713 RepID=A0ABQ5P3U5_9ACTN|nr:helix-turn-helix transcriptional regulator [Streptomyces sp. YSPA8]GLF97257.1 Scr1 family TA system antitoxin-like transcriptional regulator [Streptomyces sp. YSPA8]